MRTPSLASPAYRFGDFVLDPRAGELRKGEAKLKILGKPLDILAILLENPGRVVSREELQKHLWPSDTFVDFEHGLNSAVRRLRDALNDSAETPRYIETLTRRGYRFIKDVERLEQPPKLTRESEKSSSLLAGKRGRMLVITAAVLAVLGAVYVISGSRTRTSARTKITSVAVLPLKNL